MANDYLKTKDTDIITIFRDQQAARVKLTVTSLTVNLSISTWHTKIHVCSLQ